MRQNILDIELHIHIQYTSIRIDKPNNTLDKSFKMTRATQTVSLFLLVSSVPHLFLRRSKPALTTSPYQVYLSLFLGLVPLPEKLQDDIIPVVRLLCEMLPCPQTVKLTTWPFQTAPLLGPRNLWRIPSLQARMGCLHFQRRAASSQGTHG